jgi:hypothetical protein
MCVNAAGFGAVLAAAGLPLDGCSVVSTFDHGGLPEWEIEDGM